MQNLPKIGLPIIFLIGVLGLVLNRKNILIILMSIELMLLAINMNFVVFVILRVVVVTILLVLYFDYFQPFTSPHITLNNVFSIFIVFHRSYNRLQHIYCINLKV